MTNSDLINSIVYSDQPVDLIVRKTSESIKLTERYARGGMKPKDVTDVHPATLLLAFLTFTTGNILWDKIQAYAGEAFMRTLKDREYKTQIDRMLYESFIRINDIVKPKLYPMVQELQNEAKSGVLGKYKGQRLEKYIREKILRHMTEASGPIQAELDKLSHEIGRMVLANVADQLVVFLYREGLHAMR